MKAKELRQLSKEELISNKIQLMRDKLELLVLKKNHQLKQTHKLRMIKRNIAQLNTIIGTSTL